MNRKIILLIKIVCFFISLNAVSQTVSIADQNGNNNISTPTPQINIDCNYNFVPPKKVRLTATFPQIKNPTTYRVDPIAFAPLGLFSAGNPVIISADDTWSANIPIGFQFCFYGNNYSSLNVADNGIVRFGYNSSIAEGGFSAINNTTPSPSLIKNAIFAGFQDYLVSVGAFGCQAGDNCGRISYETLGVAPSRRMIINYNLVNHFGCSNPINPINLTKSTFQIVLYETTNIIEIYVKDKPLTCAGNSSANGGVTNSLIGLNNIDGTVGIAPINRNTSVWSATNEAYRFTPDGVSSTIISWFDSIGNLIGNSNPIDVIPTVDTFYSVRINYNTCSPLQIQSQINVAFDLNYPVAPNVSEKYCDAVLPFPNQSGIDVLALLVDPTDAVGTIKTVYFTQNEANAGPSLATPITGLNNYTLNATTQVLYYREEIGICFVTGKITLNLYQTPILSDQVLNICDAANDDTETIILSSLTPKIIGYNASTMGIEYYQNQPNALAGSNPFNFVTITNPPGFYDVYVRVFNLQNPLCFSVFKITINLLPNLVLAPIPAFCIADLNFDGQVLSDFSAIAITNLNVPVVNPNYTFYNSLFEAQNNLNPITDPTNHILTIQPAPQFVTIWAVASLAGYCPTITSVNITICIPTGNGGDGGNGGNGGFGGAGFAACLDVGDPIPSFDLEALFNIVILPAAPLPTPIGYYTTLLGAQTQDTSVQLTALQVANFVPTPLFSEIWVRYIDSNNIIGIKRLVVPVKFIKTQQIINKQLCDVYNDLKETINLNPTSIYIQEIQALNPGETITCYPTQLDYDNNTNAIVAPFNFTLDFTSNPIEDTVYIRVSSYGCDSDYKLVFTLNPFTIETPIIKNVCDVAPFGTEPYPNLGTIVTSIQPNYSPTSTLTLHPTLSSAYDQSTIITNPFNYPVSPATTVFIRITENPILFPLDCPTIQEIQFGFSDSVLINAAPTIDVCDFDDDGQVQLTNLNTYVNSVISTTNTDPIIPKLYYNLLAAQTNNPIFEILPNWDNFIYDSAVLTTNGFIYLYLENSVTGCTRIVPINLTMQSVVLPTSNDPLKICDFENNNIETIASFNIFNNQVVASSFLYNFQYFLSQADAIVGTPTIPLNYVLNNGNTIWIKITTSANASCSKIKDYVVSFTQCPVVANISPKICDNLGDNIETKNLNLYQSDIISNPSNYTFQYYFSTNDAINSSNQQPATYNMTFATSNLAVPIYVKVIDNITQCYSIAKVTFEREILIDAFDAQIFTCDISLSNTLEGLFNLTSVIQSTGTIGMIANPTDFNISYYQDLATTINIANPNAFTVLANQTSYVYVKFVNNLTNCFVVKRIELQIYQLPKFLDGEVFICDDNIDGIYSQDLNQLSFIVVNNPTPFIFEYFNSYNDAFSNINPILNLANYNVPLANFPKSIFVKGTNTNNCFKIKEVVLKKNPDVSLISNNVSLLKCDPDNNGKEIFDLTNANVLITNELGVNYQYFESFANLQNNLSPLANPTNYQNLTNGQFIYVRLSKPGINCDSWAKITLNVFYQAYNFPISEVLCDNNNDGTETINLQQIVLGYIAPLNLTNTNIQFYDSIANANTGNSVGLLSNPTAFIFTNFSTNIFVRLTNIFTGCPIVKKINFVNPSPIILIDVNKEICDFDRNNSEIINLSSYFQSMLIPAIGAFTITSYLTEANANAGTSAISNTNYLQIIPNQVYWIRSQDANGCYSVKSVTVQIILLATVSATHPTNEMCDNGTLTSNSENFQLDKFFPFGVPATSVANFNFTYHVNNADALTGANPLTSLQIASYTSPTASVWVRIISNIPNSIPACANVFEQKLLVLPFATVSATHPTNEMCDNGTLTLNSENFQLDKFFPFGVPATSVANFNFTYHVNNTDALTGANPLTSLQIASYTSPTASVWVRIISNIPNSIPACANVFEQKLLVLPFATVSPTHPTNEMCDNGSSAPNSENFQLDKFYPFGVTNIADFIVTYHVNNTDALTGANPLTSLQINSYTSPTASVWVRIISNIPNSIPACANVFEQKLLVLPFATVSATHPTNEMCDNGTLTLNSENFQLDKFFPFGVPATSVANFNFTYHISNADALTGANPLTSLQIASYTSPTASVWVRIISNIPNSIPACANVFEQKLLVLPFATVSATHPTNEMCDNGTLTLNSENFQLDKFFPFGVPATSVANFNFTYHVNNADALTGANPLTSLQIASYTSPTASVWVRIISNIPNSIPACANVFEQKLLVLPFATVSATHPTNEMCDNGTLTLNSENFQLDKFFPFGVPATSVANFNFTYHISNADALTGANPLTSLQIASYTSPTASVWVRIISNIPNSIPACANVFEQKLLVLPFATVSATHPTNEMCDNGTLTLNSENFQLDKFFPFGVPATSVANFNFTYHISNADALTGANPLTSLQIASYTSPTASVWVRIISNIPNSIPACANVFEQKLLVVPIPTPNLNPPTIIFCDDNIPGDLKEIFNLTANESYIRNGNPTYLISYFATLNGAQNNIATNQILNFNSYFSPTASVWIRIVSNTSTSLQTCAVVIEQKLQVNPLPLAGPTSTFFSCINPGTTLAPFDLIFRKSQALAGQNPFDFSVSFHLLQADAKIGINSLPLNYLSNTKIIYASVLNNLTGCRNTSPLQLIAETTTTATQPNANLTFLCDNDLANDGFTNFKLSDLNALILGTQSSATYSINYYASQNDLINNITLDQTNYTNISNPQTIIAYVENTSSNVVPKKCAAQINIVLKVNLLPVTNPKDGFVCYDQSTGGLLTPYSIESDLNNANYTFEWFLNSSTSPIFGQTMATFSVADAGEYSVIATQKAYPNCKSLIKKIKVTKSEPALAIARVEYSFTDNLNIITIATGLGSYVYQLDNGEIQVSNVFENVEPGTHKITVLDKNGCTDFVLSVIVLDYVRYFTPNSDGINDKWNIRGIKDQPDADVFIFDKYGKLITKVTPDGEGWDGTYNGQMLPSDDYWFTVKYDENGEQKEFKSHFAMKR